MCVCVGTKPLGADQAPRSHGLPPHVVARRRLPAAATTPRGGIRGLHIPTGDPPLEHKTASPAPTRGRGAGGRGGEAHHPRHTRDPKQRGARAQRARALSGGRRQGTTLQTSLGPAGTRRLDADAGTNTPAESKRPTPTETYKRRNQSPNAETRGRGPARASGMRAGHHDRRRARPPPRSLRRARNFR